MWFSLMREGGIQRNLELALPRLRSRSVIVTSALGGQVRARFVRRTRTIDKALRKFIRVRNLRCAGGGLSLAMMGSAVVSWFSDLPCLRVSVRNVSIANFTRRRRKQREDATAPNNGIRFARRGEGTPTGVGLVSKILDSIANEATTQYRTESGSDRCSQRTLSSSPQLIGSIRSIPLSVLY